MANSIGQLQKENEYIKNRYDRAQKANNVTEIYAAKRDYQDNIDKQNAELEKMDKSSPEYRKAKESIEEQETQAHNMRYRSESGNEMNELQENIHSLENENKRLGYEMENAIEKGDTRKYDELNQKYVNNIKAQEGISSDLKANGIEFEDTIAQQKISKQNHDIDMRNKMAERVQKAESKGKEASEKDKANLEKYQQSVRDDERQALEEYDNKKLKEMESYGVSQEAIARERENMERSRNRLLGEDQSR